MFRAGPALLITPNELPPNWPFGLVKFARLNRLKVSIRICSRRSALKVEVLEEGQVHRRRAGAPHRVLRGVAERAVRLRREGGGVEPAGDRALAARQVRIGDRVGTIPAARVGPRAQVRDRERRAGLDDGDAVDLPALGQRPGQPGRVLGKAQPVVHANRHAMRDDVGRARVLERQDLSRSANLFAPAGTLEYGKLLSGMCCSPSDHA